MTQLFFSFAGVNVSVETSQIAGPHSDFVAQVKAQFQKPLNRSDFAVLMVAQQANERLPGTEPGSYAGAAN